MAVSLAGMPTEL